MRAFLYPALILALLTMSGCGGGSDGNSDAPAPTAAHPAGWISQHGAAANSSPAYANCVSCHGSDLRGQGGVPSCYSASYNGQACHAGGPGAPHPLDGSYLTPSNHGPDAKRDLTVCQGCHSVPGGPGSNPRFNRGIAAAGGQGCESCHGVNLAHPAAWAGPNATFHYTAQNIQQGCTLCHGVALDGAGGVGVSCLGCHDSTATFTLDCAFCHGYPPDGTVPSGTRTGVVHGGVAAIGSHDVCVVCHGTKENATGGYFSAAPAYALFNKSTDTPGDHWDGRINMNSEPAYDEATFGCTAICHGNDAAHQLSDSGLPVALGNYGGGAGSVPHPVDGTFLDAGSHGPAAKGLTAAFPNGVLDCQPCHASAPVGADPPRFNVGIVSAGGTGCEGCHNDRTAHPSAGNFSLPREASPWYDGTFRHATARGFTTQCTLCHGANLEGVAGISPACTSCHVASPVANSSGCLSCHRIPPNGAAPAGNVRPNRPGRHGESRHVVSCAVCHNGAGFGTANHFDETEPASVVIQASFGAPAGAGSYDPATRTCNNITCHGGAGSSEGPW